MKDNIGSSTPKYNSINLKKRIKEYSRKIEENKPALSSSEPTGIINKTNRGF